MPYGMDIDRLMLDLPRQVGIEIEDNRYWTIIWTGGISEPRVMSNGVYPTLQQKEIARDLLRYLNKEVWLDGSWIISWVDGGHRQIPQRLVMLFKDKDGDVVFTVGVEESMTRLEKWDVRDYAANAEAAFLQYHEFLDRSGVKSEHMIKRAQGQQSVDPGAAPDL